MHPMSAANARTPSPSVCTVPGAAPHDDGETVTVYAVLGAIPAREIAGGDVTGACGVGDEWWHD